MEKKLTTLAIEDLERAANKKELHLLAIINNEVKCSYNEAMKELQEYSEIVSRLGSGRIFLGATTQRIIEKYGTQIEQA